MQSSDQSNLRSNANELHSACASLTGYIKKKNPYFFVVKNKQSCQGALVFQWKVRLRQSLSFVFSAFGVNHLLLDQLWRRCSLFLPLPSWKATKSNGKNNKRVSIETKWKARHDQKWITERLCILFASFLHLASGHQRRYKCPSYLANEVPYFVTLPCPPR